MERVDQLAREQMRADLPDFRPGDTVEVHVRIVEGDKERIQVFKGVVINGRPRRGHLHGAESTAWGGAF
jgi:large subunit ribosomal protein L19